MKSMSQMSQSNITDVSRIQEGVGMGGSAAEVPRRVLLALSPDCVVWGRERDPPGRA